MTVENILELLRNRGDSEYGGEAVTQLQHALQAAAHAEQDNASVELIVAALLHDIGHLLHDLPDAAPEQGIDDRHETSGFHYLSKLLPPAVTEPIRLHVPAKRFLCAVEPAYMEQLSEPSRISLELQGGPMSDEQIAEFGSNPYAEGAVQLRRWDDLAKDPEMSTPSLEHYAAYLHALAEGADDAAP